MSKMQHSEQNTFSARHQGSSVFNKTKILGPPIAKTSKNTVASSKIALIECTSCTVTNLVRVACRFLLPINQLIGWRVLRIPDSSFVDYSLVQHIKQANTSMLFFPLIPHTSCVAFAKAVKQRQSCHLYTQQPHKAVALFNTQTQQSFTHASVTHNQRQHLNHH